LERQGPLTLQTNEYYEAFLYYHGLAKLQQEKCNLGTEPYKNSVPDNLMCEVELYDVVERKYAGFSQIINDVFYGWTPDHPYYEKMEAGLATNQRIFIANQWTGKKLDLEAWLYLMLFHRITGSGINYAKKPSGYNNTLLPHFVNCDSIEDMVEVMKVATKPFYTSVGYQFPAFPNPRNPGGDPVPGKWKRSGDYYLAEWAPTLIREVVEFLYANKPCTFRQIGDFMLDWNTKYGMKRFMFQYSAFVADIADWFPEFIHRDSMFYYGSNAKQCISYLAKKPRGMAETDFLDAVMEELYQARSRLRPPRQEHGLVVLSHQGPPVREADWDARPWSRQGLQHHEAPPDRGHGPQGGWLDDRKVQEGARGARKGLYTDHVTW
jgi:hypothetical protein